jgi:hypothetical protein
MLGGLPSPSRDFTIQDGHTFINGQKIKVYEFNEHDSRLEIITLPNGDKVRTESQDKFVGGGRELEKETVEVTTKNGAIYSYSYGENGIEFTKKDSAKSPTKIISKKDFIDAATAVIGAYNPTYITELTQGLNERVEFREKQIVVNASASRTDMERKRITIDGKAAVIEEIKLEVGISVAKPPKITKAFIAGEEYKPPANFNGKGRQITLMGNDWSPELAVKLVKILPKTEVDSLRASMKSGKLTIELSEIGGDAVSQAIAGQAQQGKGSVNRAARR